MRFVSIIVYMLMFFACIYRIIITCRTIDDEDWGLDVILGNDVLGWIISVYHYG
jgi:hypothetical protein